MSRGSVGMEHARGSNKVQESHISMQGFDHWTTNRHDDSRLVTGLGQVKTLTGPCKAYSLQHTHARPSPALVLI
jgi:hypothetical protein